MPKLGLVVTTIGNGKVLMDYCTEAQRTGWQENLTIYIIPDKKTPRELYIMADHWDAIGFDVQCVLLDEQTTYLKKLGIEELIPWNSDNRRNIGYLMAVEDGCHGVVSIDDDNFCLQNNFFDEHSIVTKDEVFVEASHSLSKWLNICEELMERPFYPRGFPFFQRHERSATSGWVATQGKVAINAGLWAGNPDVDAVTWLGAERKKLRIVADELGYRGNLILGPSVWSPINSQNTAVSRNAMAAYYFIPMGSTVNGMKIDRFGDIFSGYFAESCVKHMKEYIRFGSPVVEHIRNSHNYMDDLKHELVCYELLDELLAWLTEAKLEGSTYPEAYLSLANLMVDAVEKFKGSVWTPDSKGFFHRISYCMKRWVQTYNRVTSYDTEQSTRNLAVEA
jgi:hypothetical protein